MNAEEVELLSDSKYRNYVAAVDKALKNFEYSSEWADLISALGKLNKVIVFCMSTSISSAAKFVIITVYHPSTLAPGFAEQCKISSGSQEADNRQKAGPVPPSCAAQWGPPQGLGNI